MRLWPGNAGVVCVRRPELVDKGFGEWLGCCRSKRKLSGAAAALPLKRHGAPRRII